VSRVEISRAGPESLDRLRALWLELHHHHQAVLGPRLGPFADDAASWTARRALYAGFLAEGGFAILAERDGALIGYAMVAIKSSEETELDDTWRAGARVAEIETMSVLPAERGRGVGAALLDRIDAELAAAGVRDVLVAAMATNAHAIRLYERRGFRPSMLQMIRLGDRP
jgi:ribosomal protein S18 acetylase RimI-like enzyme